MDPQETLRRTWSLFKAPDAIVEVRALDCQGRHKAWDGWSAGTVSGYFDDEEAFVRAVTRLDAAQRASGIYVTLNPVMEDLLARAANKLKAAKTEMLTHDEQIARRRWLLLDFDPIRPAGISSTTQELRQTLETAKAAQAALAGRGWPWPVQAMSGNGVHLLYRIDLPNDEPARLLQRSILQRFRDEFADDKIGLDTSVHNASRVVKLYGTAARKGDPTKRRPHRRAQFLEEICHDLTD